MDVDIHGPVRPTGGRFVRGRDMCDVEADDEGVFAAPNVEWWAEFERDEEERQKMKEK